MQFELCMSNELSSAEYDIIAEHIFTQMLYIVRAVSLNPVNIVKAKEGLFSKIYFYLFFEIIPLFALHLDHIAFLASPAVPSRSLPPSLPSNIITCFLTHWVHHCQVNWNPSLPEDLARFQFGLMKRSTCTDHSLCCKSFGDCFSSATIKKKKTRLWVFCKW